MAEKPRSETLEREARNEAEIVWYAAMASDRAGELIRAFESKYPFVKIRFQPGGAGRQIEQLMVEHRTKKPRADIINTRRSFVGVMAKAGAVALPHAAAGIAARRIYRQGRSCQQHIRSARVFFSTPAWLHATRRRKRSKICSIRAGETNLAWILPITIGWLR